MTRVDAHETPGAMTTATPGPAVGTPTAKKREHPVVTARLGPRVAATVAFVDSAAIEANVARLVAVAPGSAFCAVVKADGYGHGVLTAAEAALAAGASWLAVATVDEAVQVVGALRSDIAGDVVGVLVLSEITPGLAADAQQCCGEQVRFTVASVDGIRALAAADIAFCRNVHLKIDTGMHRMGASTNQLPAVAEALRSAVPRLHLEAVWTHLAVADVPGDPFTGEQLQRFEQALTVLGHLGVSVPMTHTANSAGLMAHPDARRDLVRPGIACYGVAPSLELADVVDLQPALRLVSRVSALRDVPAGESVSYGRRWYAGQPVRVATVPAGYADGIRRDSGDAGVEVLVRGQRCGIIGAVTMDQLMVVVHPSVSESVTVDDEVVLIGRQGEAQITASEVAGRLGTIAYEVLTGISARVPRLVT